MRVPQEFAQSADAEVVVRVKTGVLGTLEVARKLSDLPQKEPPDRWTQWLARAMVGMVVVMLGAGAVRYERRCHRLLHGLCVHCGHDLTNNGNGACAECGTPLPSRAHDRTKRRVLIILSILSLLLLAKTVSAWIDATCAHSQVRITLTTRHPYVWTDAMVEWRSSRLAQERQYVPDLSPVFSAVIFSYTQGSLDGTATDYRVLLVPYWFLSLLCAAVPIGWGVCWIIRTLSRWDDLLSHRDRAVPPARL